MSDTTQVSAHISLGLKERMERYARKTGITRARLIEQALSHHLLALEELPADVIVPARLVLSHKSAECVLEAIHQPHPPTEAMRQLFDDR